MSKVKKIGLILRTVKHLKWTQVSNQVKNRLKKAKPLSAYHSTYGETNKLAFFEISEAYDSLRTSDGAFHFEFLNLEQAFGETIDWNFMGHGKLWNYNLQYLDYLRQQNLEVSVKLELIHQLYGALNSGKLKLEPYPASLRIMNLVRFVSTQELEKEELHRLNSYIKAEFGYLSENIEYHLLANHLLENLFALNMAAAYFKDQKAVALYEQLMRVQLDEQILKDGAHYEVSPMYHKIIFFRVLELFHYLPQSPYRETVNKKLSGMHAWLKNISFRNGEVPDFNDSTSGITFSNAYFYGLCEQLGIHAAATGLSDSGYRKYEAADLEAVIDVNGIEPSYQPGHAHADTFSFCLNYKNKALIVDPGISTYNISARRNWERSTAAHNTLELNSENSAEVWSGFRVGRRLDVKILRENQNSIEASHTGYRRFGAEVKRSFSLENQEVIIRDEVISGRENKATVYFHFHPETQVSVESTGRILLNGELTLEFGAGKLSIETYDYCLGYNRFAPAKKAKIELTNKTLETRIKAL